MSQRMLVVAPHPDDEVLGAGGTIARAVAEGVEVTVLVVTRGHPSQFDADLVEAAWEELREAHAFLGVATRALDLPAAAIDTVPHHELNAAIGTQVEDLRPHVILAPFPGDIHLDHRRSFLSLLVAARPNRSGAVPAIYAYETLSETNWNAPYLTPGFHPTLFVDISSTLEAKLRALSAYRSQVKPFPHERSLEAVRALARLRGATVHTEAAEAFVVIRDVRGPDRPLFPPDAAAAGR